MSRPIDAEVDYRQLNRQALYDAAFTAVHAHLPGLTDGQKKRLATFIAEEDESYVNFRTENGWPCPSQDELRGQVLALQYLNRPDAETFRAAPSAGELTRALIAQLPASAGPTDKINIERTVARMGPDERLEKSRDLDLTAATTTPAAKQAAAEITADERTRGIYCVEDRLLEQKGYDMRNVLPLKRRELHAMIAKEMAPKATPASDTVAAAKLVGRPLTPTERINAARESGRD